MQLYDVLCIIFIIILIIIIVYLLYNNYKKEKFLNCKSLIDRPNKGGNSLKVFLDPVFNGSLPGTVIYPEDPLYGYASQHFNVGVRQSFPGAVVFCRSINDIVACVKTACKWNFAVHVRCGRHDYGGYSSGEGLIIDVSRMKNVYVDESTKIATLGAGLRLGDAYDALSTYGLTINGGTCPGVGLAGLILGGGAGPFERMHGMLCDMMVSATIVLANGNIVKADKNNNCDLFWALKGGGAGNFGVAAEFEVQCFDIPDNGLDYHISWLDWNDTVDVVMAYQHLLTNLTIDNIWVRLFMMTMPPKNQSKVEHLELLNTHTGVLHDTIRKHISNATNTEKTARLYLTVHYVGDVNDMKNIINPILQTGKVDWSSEHYKTYNKQTYMSRHIADWATSGKDPATAYNDLIANVPVLGDQSIILANPLGLQTKIQMKAVNNKWITVANDGTLQATANTPDKAEKFVVKALPNTWNVTHIQLQAHTGKWVTSANGSKLIANVSTPGNNETFSVNMPLHSYNIQLQTNNGSFVGLNGINLTINSNNSNSLLYLNHRPPNYTTRPKPQGNRFNSLFGGQNNENGRIPEIMDRKGIEFIVNFLPTFPGVPHGGMILIDSTGGHQARVTDNAYSHRSVLWISQLMANYDFEDDAQTREVIEWMRKLYEGFSHYAIKSNGVPLAYRNYANLDIKYSGIAYYTTSLDKLVSIKNKYDPNNVFTYTQAIKSTVAGTSTNPSQNITCYDAYNR